MVSFLQGSSGYVKLLYGLLLGGKCCETLVYVLVATYEEEIERNLKVLSFYLIYIRSIIIDFVSNMMKEIFREIVLWIRRDYGITFQIEKH